MARVRGDDAVEGQAKTSTVRRESVVAAAMAEVAHSSAASKFVAPVRRIVFSSISWLVKVLMRLRYGTCPTWSFGAKKFGGRCTERVWTLTFFLHVTFCMSSNGKSLLQPLFSGAAESCIALVDQYVVETKRWLFRSHSLVW